MNGYQCWRMHRATVLHMTSQSYDIFKYRGQTTGTTESVYANARGRSIFERVAKIVKTPRECLEFFVSQLIYTGTDQTFDPSSLDNYRRWIREKESMTKMICDNLEQINSECLSGSPPKLFGLMLNGEVLPQTVTALNRRLNFLPTWIEQNYFGLGKYPIILSKLDKFITFNEDRVNQLIDEKFA